MLDLQRTTEIAVEIAQEAGELAWGYYGQVQALRKEDGSLVTRADREAEELVRRRLAAAFPKHGVFGEEYGLGGCEDSPYVWYIDPIDGTSNFVYGIPLWGVSLGLTYREKSIAGAFTLPPTRETYWGWQGGGAYLNGRRLQVLDPGEGRPNDLVSIASTTAELYELSLAQKMRCLGSAAQAFAAVAAGSFVAAIQDNWHTYDFGAVLVMCQEAGALVTDVAGEPFTGFTGMGREEPGKTLIAAGPKLLPHMLKALKPRD